jgi:hypothetical protein
MTGAAYGQPVVLSQPKTQLARDICGITRRLAGMPPETHRFGWLPRRGARRARVKMSRNTDDTRGAQLRRVTAHWDGRAQRWRRVAGHGAAVVVQDHATS